MTSSTTRSSRSTTQKKAMPNTENAISKAKTSTGIKKKLRTNKKDADPEKQYVILTSIVFFALNSTTSFLDKKRQVLN